MYKLQKISLLLGSLKCFAVTNLLVAFLFIIAPDQMITKVNTLHAGYKFQQTF